jgi:hypothetical protein
MTATISTALVLTVVSMAAAGAQSPGDVGTLDQIIRAYYEVISGPAGKAPDRVRDEFLHIPNAQVGLPIRAANGASRVTMMTLREFYDKFGGVRTQPLYEREIHRVTRCFGTVANVWSTYVVAMAPGGPPIRRGINTINLHFDGARWWITNWIADEEHPGLQIPRHFLPPAGRKNSAPSSEELKPPAQQSEPAGSLRSPATSLSCAAA